MPHHNAPAPVLPARIISIFGLVALSIVGCSEPEPITSYVIPTEIPPELVPEKDRMLAAMVPHDDQVWFFKVTGPESVLESVASTYRDFVRSIEFDGGEPKLVDLPETWQMGRKKPMRFASINVDTSSKQLDISVSSLSRQSNWDEQVTMNVNRWRGQLGLDPSDDHWAGAESFAVDASDGESVWVDLVGDGSTGGSSMSPPMMSSMAGGMPTTGQATTGGAPTGSPASKPPIQFERPDGWRDGKKSSMRWASFNVGPEDAEAEVTVMPAGGDTRNNVDRWLGQIRADVADDVVDQAMSDAVKIQVDGRESERFVLSGDESDGEGQGGRSIDATIVPLEDNFSLFIKMTGPTETVTQQHDALTSFLESIEL